MSHTILLVQPTKRPEGRTYADFESVNECMEGVCKMYEEHLKRMNPNSPSITYDISQLFDFIDDLADLSCLVYRADTQTYQPYNKDWIKGKIRNMVDQLRRCQCAGFPPSELPEKYRICLAAPLPGQKKAVVIPISDQDKVLAVLLVGCKPLSEQDELHLNVLEKHASVACVRLQSIQGYHQRPPLSPSLLQSHNALLQLNVSEQDYCELDHNILQLCGELYDLDAASLQLKVINYLQQQTRSQCCCLLLVSEDNHQLFCQVVGDKVLEEEISFPLMFGRFGQVVEKKKSISLQDISAEERRQQAAK